MKYPIGLKFEIQSLELMEGIVGTYSKGYLKSGKDLKAGDLVKIYSFNKDGEEDDIGFYEVEGKDGFLSDYLNENNLDIMIGDQFPFGIPDPETQVDEEIQLSENIGELPKAVNIVDYFLKLQKDQTVCKFLLNIEEPKEANSWFKTVIKTVLVDSDSNLMGLMLDDEDNGIFFYDTGDSTTFKVEMEDNLSLLKKGGNND